MTQLSDEVVERLVEALKNLIEAADATAWSVNTSLMNRQIEQGRAAIAAYEAKGDVVLDEGRGR